MVELVNDRFDLTDHLDLPRWGAVESGVVCRVQLIFVAGLALLLKT